MPSTAKNPTVFCKWVLYNKVPLWRHIVPCEDGVETNLANMTQEGAAELRSQYAIARCALGDCQWETALSSLLRCRDVLKGEEARVGKSSYGMLLLWAEIPLAQMYQLRGSAEGSAQMLQKAVETWREIFDGIMPFFVDPALGLDLKLLSFRYTAEYECGCASGDYSEMKFHAMRNYAGLMGYGRADDAEHELCLLLSYDHYWSGSFEDSLKWIQKANRLWQQILPPAAYLRWEVSVLMKLQRFKEARSALDRLSSAEVPVNEVEKRAEEVRLWKQDCEMQMHKDSASVGDLQEPIEDEELRELQYALELSVTLNSNEGQAAQHGHTEAKVTPVEKIMDEMLTPDSTSVRSWLSVERFKTVNSYILKLPEGPRAAISRELLQLTEAFKQKSFEMAIFRLNCCREILRTIKKCVENEAYYSILASVDHLLADLYQFCENHLLCQFEKALEIRKELLSCIQYVAPLDKYMEQHYMSLVLLTEYQGCSSEDVSREQIVQKYASLMGMKKKQAECDMCFWLFFRDNCLWRKLGRLKHDVMPGWEHSGINHSLPYTHLMRCEVELLLDTVKFLMGEEGEKYDLGTAKMLLEQAEGILKNLLQRFEGQSSYKAWVHSMLEECYLKMCKSATAAGDPERADGYQDLADRASAFHLSLLSELGLHQFKKPSSIAVTNRSHLIQVEEHIMEQFYWVRFPSDHYLAFRKLYEIGHYAQEEGNWECAIFNLELCRDLLTGLKERFKNAEFDSSLAWVDLPLVQLHHMKTKNLKKSLDLRQEVRDCLGSLSVVDPYVQLAVNGNLHAALYHLGHSNYPSRMDEIMNEITKLVPKSKFDGEIKQLVVERASGSLKDMDKVDQLMMLKLANEECAGKRREFWECFMLIQGPKYWEYYIVSILLYWHFVQGDYETAFQDVIGLLKQVVDKHFSEDREKKEQNVVYEAECLMELKMFQDADLVLKQSTGGKTFKELSRPIQQSIEMCQYGISGLHAALFEASRNVALYYLRITGVTCQYLRRYEEAAYLHTQCIRIIEAAKNGSHQAPKIITEHRGLPGWYDYFQIGVSYRKMFETRLRSNAAGALLIHPHSSDVKLEEPSIQDVDFTSALLSFQQQMKLVVNPDFMARGNHEVLKLYAAMGESYFDYLLIKFGLKNAANKEQFDHGVADMNNVKLMEDENHMKAQCNLTSTEQSILEEVEANMIKYGRRTSLQFANSLYAMKGSYTESWIKVLEGHKDVYTKLQRHYLNKMFLEALTTPDYNPELQPKIIDEYRWKAFLYAERQRSRVLLYQLGPQKLTSLVARQLWEFDTSDSHAMETIEDHVTALEKDSVFVEYNHLQEDVWIIYVVQGGRLGHYLLTLKSEMELLEGKISDILLHMNNDGKKMRKTGKKMKKTGKKMKKKYTYNNDRMNEDLQYLHDILIKPIASHLCQMKLQHKLILAPTELLTKVPFAALRDRTRPDKEKYLIQRHTISLVPSLRALQRCNERLEVLQKLDSHEGLGAIVALGDPTYGENSPLSRLFGTKTEVDDIAKAFPKMPVVKLLGEDATAEKLLHWVGNPLHKSSRQHIVHIGAHGRVDDHDERNSCLFLARPSAAGPPSKPPPAGKRMVDELDMDDEENDEVGTIDEESMEVLSDVSTRTIAEVKELNINREKEKGKGKVEEKGEEDSKLEQEKDKDKDEEEECIEPVEIPIEELIEWAERKFHEAKILNWNIFVEYPELTTKPKERPDSYGPRVCSVLALKDMGNSKVPWRAELVVLSACHTSEGKATAEGLVNLARAFIIAGVPCVVASQWAVPDVSTSALMKEFYNQLRHGNDVASSMRLAMLSLIESDICVDKIAFNHMCAWAPFVIWGSSSYVLPEYLHCEGCEVCRPPSLSARDDWSRLPNVLVQQVLSLIAVPDLCKIRTVCKRWNSLICMPEFENQVAQNENDRYIIGRCSYEHLNSDGVWDSIKVVSWSMFDLNERRWFTWKDELLKPFGNAQPLVSDGGLVLCCSMLTGTVSISKLIISNPIGNSRKELPIPPSGWSILCTTSFLVKLVVNSISHTYRIFLINRYQDPVLCIFESTTNQWRSSSNTPAQLKGCGVGAQAHSVIFQGLLYVLSKTYIDTTPVPQERPAKFWLNKYNFLEDSWADCGVTFPEYPDNGVNRIELVVSGNRLFVVSGYTLWLEASNGSDIRLEDPLVITEILLADRTLNVVSNLAEPLFNAQGLIVNGTSFEFNQTFGFGNFIMFTYQRLGFAIVYDVVTCLWELWPADPTVQLFGNAMSLQLSSVNLREANRRGVEAV